MPTIKITAGEAIDRLLIQIIKAYHFQSPEKLTDVLLSILPEDHELREPFMWGDKRETIQKLREVHKQLWDCESKIRKTDKSDNKALLEVSLEIARLNDRRAGLVASINNAQVLKEY